MLRDDLLVMLEEVIARCEDSAATLATATADVGDDDLAALFLFIEEERRRMIANLRDLLLQRGQPSREREFGQSSVHRWVTRVRAAFTVDRRIVLLEECERSEQILGEAMVRALGAPLPGEARRALTYFEADVTAARGRLKAIRTRLRPI